MSLHSELEDGVSLHSSLEEAEALPRTQAASDCRSPAMISFG